MKKFSDFSNPVPKGAYVPETPVHFRYVAANDAKPYVPAAPIHFKYVGTAEPKPFVPDEPVHFKHVNDNPAKPIKEDASNFTKHSDISSWEGHHDNDHMVKAHEGHSAYTTAFRLNNKLIDSSVKHKAKTKEHVHDYTHYESEDTNNALLKLHHENATPRGKNRPEQIKSLDAVTKHPIGHELHVYSGVGFHPGEIKHVSSEGHHLIHLPAYTSTTHNKRVAAEFASHNNKRGDNDDSHHIIHVHLKPTDRAAHISHMSEHPNESETLLPRNTTLKVHPKPDVYSNKYTGVPVHVWHATVHHQEEHN